MTSRTIKDMTRIDTQYDLLQKAEDSSRNVVSRVRSINNTNIHTRSIVGHEL